MTLDDFLELVPGDKVILASTGEVYLVDYIGETDDNDYVVIKKPLQGDGYILYPEDRKWIL